MIRLFFRRNGEIIFLDIVQTTNERIWQYRRMQNASVQEIADCVFAAFGKVTDETINKYLDAVV